MTPALSVVVPLYNEAAVLPELVRRLKAAVAEVSGDVEILLVDDASTDGSRAILEGLDGVAVVRMAENVGQFRATCAGLGAAKGGAVAVLDGDLQDPPEVLSALFRALGDSELAFAVKTKRADPLWFRVGRWGYRVLASFGRGVPPSGAGSYCAMGRTLAQRVAQCPWRAANLASVAVTLAEAKGPWPMVEYAKAARYDGRSRVGLLGLVEEAIGSLRVTGALSRVLLLLFAAAAALWCLG
jgi:glycosyltransferase involved in cell wall biosynthesis